MITTDESIAEPAPPSTPSKSAARRGLRFSVTTAAWMLTVAALAIGLYLTGREIDPLRRSLLRLREEMGYFEVADETRVHAKRVAVKIPTAWQWRLFLPENDDYMLRMFVGRTIDPQIIGRKKWIDLLRENARDSGDELAVGEFGFEVLLTEYDGTWWLRYGRLADDGTTLGLPAECDWLDDETRWVVASDASYESVETFQRNEPIVLLHIEARAAAPGSEADADGELGAERLVLWLDPE